MTAVTVHCAARGCPATTPGTTGHLRVAQPADPWVDPPSQRPASGTQTPGRRRGGPARTLVCVPAADQPDQPRVAPLDPPMLPFAIAGTVAWAVLGLILLAAHDWVREHGHNDWLWTCLAGVLLGLLGTVLMALRERRRRTRRDHASRDQLGSDQLGSSGRAPGSTGSTSASS